ncbi:MAG TPA: O-methyltransferase [Polyangia bacterium]|jgi:predicted O-methyltransferase YrrM
MDRIVDGEIEHYLEQLQRTRDVVLAEMEDRGEAAKFPIIGPLVGRLCQQAAMSVGARDVFEMGSGFGYSTWWFAHAVGDGGRVVHTDNDAKLSAEAKSWMDKAGLGPRVHYEVGDACEIIKKYPGPFDVVFIDVDKHAYPQALELARSRVRIGGYIVCDNALWSGNVLLPPGKQDADARGVIRYNKDAFGAADLLTTIVPLRDGVALSLKIAPDKRRR